MIRTVLLGWPPCFAPDIRFSGRTMRHLEELFGGPAAIDAGIPDRTNRVVGILANGDRVWMTWSSEGRHRGVQFREISMPHSNDDKIVELDMMADD